MYFRLHGHNIHCGFHSPFRYTGYGVFFPIRHLKNGWYLNSKPKGHLFRFLRLKWNMIPFKMSDVYFFLAGNARNRTLTLKYGQKLGGCVG